LADKGHEVCVAHDGYAALELAKVFRPELILLDIFMQGMDGYEVCCRIREEVWGKGLLIIALSGFGASETRHRAVRAGFDHYLTKPIELAQIESLMQTWSANNFPLT